MKIKTWHELSEFQQQICGLLLCGNADYLELARGLLLEEILKIEPDFLNEIEICEKGGFDEKTSLKIRIKEAQFLKDFGALKPLHWFNSFNNISNLTRGLFEKRTNLYQSWSNPPNKTHKYFHLFVDIDTYLNDWGEKRLSALSEFPFEAKNNLVFIVSLRVNNSKINTPMANKIAKFCASFCPMVAKCYPNSIVELQCETPEFKIDKKNNLIASSYIDSDNYLNLLFCQYLGNAAQKNLLANYNFRDGYFEENQNKLKTAVNCNFVWELQWGFYLFYLKKFIQNAPKDKNLTYRAE